MEQTKTPGSSDNQETDRAPMHINEKFFASFYPFFVLATPAFLIFPQYERFEIADDTYHYPFSTWENLTAGYGGGFAGALLAAVLVGLLVWSMVFPEVRVAPGSIAIVSIFAFSLVISRSGTLYDFDLSASGILLLYATAALTLISIGHESVLTYKKYRGLFRSECL